MDSLAEKEAESIAIFREVAGLCKRPVLLYSVGKDSSVLLHLARKAFLPQTPPFPLMHIDTSYKFPEMYDFRDNVARDHNMQLIVVRNEEAIAKDTNPFRLRRSQCCGFLKTEALLNGLKDYGADGAIGGARREEEKSRAKERVFSVRTQKGGWDPRVQRPEPWMLFNAHLAPGESLRVFPLSNWTELEIWEYILREKIPVVPLYFAEKRKIVERHGALIPLESAQDAPDFDPATVKEVECRFRTLGCMHCTGAVESTARSIPEIIRELEQDCYSERAHRLIDTEEETAMEQKKREGYF